MDDNYYNKQHDFYSSYYKGKTIYERNGFDEYPIVEYSMFVNAIESLPEKTIKVIDIGCGNALLLKHIIKNTHKKVTPYGVDFLSKSIIEAKRDILPKFAGNFLCINAIDFVFLGSFDVVLFDPSILRKENRNVFFQRIMESKSHYCIVYTYSDVIIALNLSNALALLSKTNVNSIIYSAESEKMSLFVLDLSL